jgi:hypothetical protein
MGMNALGTLPTIEDFSKTGARYNGQDSKAVIIEGVEVPATILKGLKDGMRGSYVASTRLMDRHCM